MGQKKGVFRNGFNVKILVYIWLSASIYEPLRQAHTHVFQKHT